MTEKSTQLALNDFVLAVSIIDACTERGAFKGNELLVVGKLRETFSNFVDENKNEDVDTDEPTPPPQEAH